MKLISFLILFGQVLLAEESPLKPFTPDFKIELNAEQKAKMEKGELVFWEKFEDLPGKRYYKEGSAVFRVHAKPEAIWKMLSDFKEYPNWAYKVGKANDYKAQEGDKYYIEFSAQVVGKKYHVEHDFPMAKKGYGLWKTDHGQKNDCVLDTVGIWKVDPVKDHSNQSDVYYSGKVILSRLCANGVLGMGGFNGQDMGTQTYNKIKQKLEVKAK